MEPSELKSVATDQQDTQDGATSQRNETGELKEATRSERQAGHGPTRKGEHSAGDVRRRRGTRPPRRWPPGREEAGGGGGYGEVSFPYKDGDSFHSENRSNYANVQ